MKFKAPASDWNAEQTKPAEELFTDREAPRKAFWDVYHSMEEDDIAVVSYYGVGGIGKTTLLKKLSREMEEQLEYGKGDYVYISLEGNSFKDDILYNLSRQMMVRNKGLSFPLFDAAFTRIAEDEGKDISGYEQTAKQRIMDSDFMTVATTVLGDAVPLGGSIALGVEYLIGLGTKIRDKKDKEANAALYSRIEVSSVSENRANLQRYFTADACRVFSERKTPFVIFIDGYENLVNYVEQSNRAVYEDAWIRDLEKGLVLIPNTLWVIAGREKLSWPEELLPAKNSHRIGNLSEKDAASFFEKSGIKDEKLVSQLYSLTSGTPIFMDLCVETYRFVSRNRVPQIGDFGKNTDELAKRYLKGMDRDQQWVLSVIAAFPNIWTDEMAEYVLVAMQSGSSLRILKDFMKLSLIERLNYGNRLHETIRKIINRNTDPGELQKIRSFAAEFLLKKLRGLSKADYRLDLVQALCEMISDGSISSMSEDDFRLLSLAMKEEFEGNGDFLQGNALAGIIRGFAEKADYSPETYLIASNCLCRFCYLSGRYEEMEILARENLQYAEKNLPENDPAALTALLNQSTSCSALGDFSRAMELRKCCYEKRLQVLGPDDPDTLLALRYWASSCTDLRRGEESLALKEKCYEAYKRVYGEDSKDTLMTLNNLANSYALTGDGKTAAELFARCYEKRCVVLGKEHPFTLMTLGNLANVYAETQPERALALREQSFASRLKVLGPDHPYTVKAMSNYALSKDALGMHQEALALHRESLEIGRKLFGSGSVQLNKMINNTANSLSLAGEPAEAEKLYGESLANLTKLLGDDHPDVQTVKENLSRLTADSGSAGEPVSFVEWE